VLQPILEVQMGQVVAGLITRVVPAAATDISVAAAFAATALAVLLVVSASNRSTYTFQAAILLIAVCCRPSWCTCTGCCANRQAR
jgi:hypothetical protein